MRGGTLINFDDYEILKRNISTLKQTSVDKHDMNNISYMTDSDRSAVNFDDVKQDYVKNLSLSETPKSNDALFLSKDNKLIFVEFKNGYVDSGKEYAVRRKIYDSIIILTDILNVKISCLKKEMEYILVYNESANPYQKRASGARQQLVQHSASFDGFAKALSRMANTEHVGFGIRMFENYCFSKVHTYTEAEFERYLQDN